MQSKIHQTSKLFGFTSKIKTSVKPLQTTNNGVEFETAARLLTLGVGGFNAEGGDPSYYKR